MSSAAGMRAAGYPLVNRRLGGRPPGAEWRSPDGWKAAVGYRMVVTRRLEGDRGTPTKMPSG